MEQDNEPDVPEKQEKEFPDSIEGTRGDKDSARRAQEFYRSRRGLDANDNEDSSDENNSTTTNDRMKTEEEKTTAKAIRTVAKIADFDIKGGSLGEDFHEMEKMLAQDAEVYLAETDTLMAKDSNTLAISVGITGVSTSSQAGNQNVFLLNSDALTFVIRIQASQDLVNSGRKFNASYQIIDMRTNVVKKIVSSNNTPFSWGTSFWISQGNNWGPSASDYTTPYKWGLTAGVYIFRATVEVQGIAAFSYSNEHYFRVR